MTTERIRVFLADDHEIVRGGIAALIDAQDDMEVVGEAATAAQARSRILAVLPDIAVLDVRLPDGSGIDVCRKVKQEAPGIRCLMLTAYDDEDALRAAIIAGADGYVIKDIRGSTLLDDIRAASRGKRLIDPRVASRVTSQLKEPADDPRFDSLVLRERQVLALIADGFTNRQIGEKLGLAEKTVKNYVSSLLAKLGLERRTQAAVFQLEHRGHGESARIAKAAALTPPRFRASPVVPPPAAPPARGRPPASRSTGSPTRGTEKRDR